MKKIICLIDALGAGGAERQMVGLAVMLSRSGYEVTVCYHEPQHFFVDELEANNITVSFIERHTVFEKLLAIYKLIKTEHPLWVIAYLQSSCIYASLLKGIGMNFNLIVSERNSNLSRNLRDDVRFNLFRVADYVVPNSYSQTDFIKRNYPFLSTKLHTIVNYVDTEKFRPIEKSRNNVIIVAATIWTSKNTLGLIKAAKILKDRNISFYIKWFGKIRGQENYIRECESLITELGLCECVELLYKTKEIASEYQKASYFCLPSFYEGTPNAICEAMASGLPIVCSNVCDNGRYVEDGVNGFLFNPNNVEDIANALHKALTLNNEQWMHFSSVSRERVLNNLTPEKFIARYLNLINNS